MRCIVHIGTEKTGSTAIQRSLAVNRAKLSEQGICFGKAAGPVNNRAFPALFMSMEREDDFIRQRRFRDAAQREKWREELLTSVAAEMTAARESHDLFIVSSEHFHSRLVRGQEVLALRDFLREHFSDVRVVCYLRRQDSMAMSLYTQALRAGHCPDTILPAPVEEGKRLPVYYDFEALLRRWGNAFGGEALDMREYNREHLAGGDVVNDFSSLLGDNLGLESPKSEFNASLSADAQLALLIFNRMLRESNKLETRKPRRRLVTFLESRATGKGRMPDRNSAEAFYRQFKSGNDACARQWLGRDHLFEENFSDYPAVATDGRRQRALLLLADYLAEESRTLFARAAKRLAPGD